jgi:hypothetical protein
MDAIRNSENYYGVLESFWKGQLQSKEWLIESLHKFIPVDKINLNVVIHGGWNGVLASLLYNSGISVNLIRSIDVDENCEETANTINKRQQINAQFKAVTCDMCNYEYEFEPDIVINTSTEHITQEQYEIWLNRVPQNSLIVLQSNNYTALPEHIRCANDIDDFTQISKLKTIYHKDVLNLPMYDRYLIIGKK